MLPGKLESEVFSEETNRIPAWQASPHKSLVIEISPSRLHQLNAICAILGASDRDKSLDLRGLGLRKRL